MNGILPSKTTRLQQIRKQTNRCRNPTLRHISRTHRVDLDRLYDRINVDPMIQIKYVNTTQKLADIFANESFTRDRCAKLTLLVSITTHSTFTQSNLSVSSAVMNLFSSMSRRVEESFAASAGKRDAKASSLHCNDLRGKLPTKDADRDYHVPPPDYIAGGDSKRDEPCQQDPNSP